MARPTLVVISGPPGSGKTTLAHALAREIGCPAICRDEIKEGMAFAVAGFRAGPSDELSLRTLAVFFDVLELLLHSGVTVVAESAFQDRLWRPGLERLAPLAHLRIVHCETTPEMAAMRRNRRATESPRHVAVHGVAPAERGNEFNAVAIEAPAIRVQTTDGYNPSLADVAAFVASGGDRA